MLFCPSFRLWSRFIVSVETEFYENFRPTTSMCLKEGPCSQMDASKKAMQRTLMQEISFLMEVQLLLTIVSIAIGMKLLPENRFTMAQLDSFNILVLSYFLFSYDVCDAAAPAVLR
ncbi:exopolysaccharide Pel transporter PelG [Paenibacillus sp. JTLBN-2024]